MVKYAETKNSALVATGLVILGLIYDKICFGSTLQILFSLGYILIAISIIISLLSFFPDKGSKGTENMFLFSNIARLSSYEEFKERITDKYYCNKDTKEIFTTIDEDVLKQVYKLSMISNRKYVLFSWSIVIFLIGLLIIIITSIFN